MGTESFIQTANFVLYQRLGTQHEGKKGSRCPGPSKNGEIWPLREPLQHLLLFLNCHVPWIHKYDVKNNAMEKIFFDILKLASWVSESEWNSLVFPVLYSWWSMAPVALFFVPRTSVQTLICMLVYSRGQNELPQQLCWISHGPPVPFHPLPASPLRNKTNIVP